MINIEKIETIIEWGFDIEIEYHQTKANEGIKGIKDEIITSTELFTIWYIYQDYLDFDFDELLEMLKRNPVYIGFYKFYTTYKIRHDDALTLITFSDYLNAEFYGYLRKNNILAWTYNNSDIEGFFEQYGIKVC